MEDRTDARANTPQHRQTAQWRFGPEPGASPMSSLPQFRQRMLMGLVLMAGTLGAFWPATHCEFINLDDQIYVTENRQVLSGITPAGLRWAFTNLDAGLWHPLTWLSHMLDCQLYGLNPGGHHLTNLLLHSASAALLFLALRTMTGALGRSALVAALFALHPLRVESVAWVAERKDVLGGFFLMGALWAYAHYAQASRVKCHVLGNQGGREQKPEIRIPKSKPALHREDNRYRVASASSSFAPYASLFARRFLVIPCSALWYSLALICFALGLMSKPTVITLPLVLPLLDYWPLKRFGQGPVPFQRKILSRLVIEKVPMLAAGFLCSLATLHAVGAAGALPSAARLPISERLANASLSSIRYLGQAIFPFDLAVYYPYPASISGWSVAGAVLLLLAISVIALRTVRWLPFFLTGWLWYLVTLLPVSGLVQVGAFSHADRCTYVPLIGIFMAAVWGAGELLARLRLLRTMAGTLAAVVIAACAARTIDQLSHWRDSGSLFRHTLAVTRENALALVCLGEHLQINGQVFEATDCYRKALQISPNFDDALTHLAAAFVEQQRYAEAIGLCEAALRISPADARAEYFLANALAGTGRRDQAKAHYLTALRLRPDLAEAHYQMAMTSSAEGRTDEAIEHLRQVLRTKPDWLEALNNLAWILATHPNRQFRDGAEAVRLAAHAVQLTRTNNAGALDTLAAAYAGAGRFPDAMETAKLALDRATAAGQMQLAADIQKHRQAYDLGQPVRE